MPDLYIIATLIAKPDNATDLRTLLTAATPKFRAEDGCLAYTLLEDQKNPGRFVTYERWRDAAALAAHMHAPTLTALQPQLPNLLAADMTQDFLSPLVIT